ncbi:hypothetical protein D3C77_492570 [compost metagenome]
MPALSAASAIRERSSLFERSRYSCGKHSKMSRIAEIAKLSETGLALIFQIDSRACDKASKPVETVTPAGTVNISSGSIIATFGQVQSRCREYFFWLPLSQIVAHGVTSLPVPAVVGAAIRALLRAGSKALPVASKAKSSSKVPVSVPTINAFAVSMALPPPTAITVSQSAASRQNRS